MRSSVIVLELNELTPTLMERYMAQGALPGFKRLHDESEVHTTVAEEEQDLLDPWIQWITVHSGLAYREHQIQNLGDGDRLEVDNIWDVVSRAGDSVWVCGSMNATYRPPLRGWMLPDPWMTRTPPVPGDELAPYIRFVSAYVTDYTSKKVRLDPLDYARFLAFMVRHGLTPATVMAIARQLLGERLGERDGWRRATILDRLQFDLFRAVYGRLKPRLATFFLNSTAHFQHLYWRDMEPERFTIKPDEAHRRAHETAILYGYQQMDRLITETLELAGPDVSVVLCTALSQQPCTIYDERGGKSLYRPRDWKKFLHAVGITAPATVAAVMAQQFHIELASEAEARDAETKLRALRHGGANAMYVERDGRKVFTGCRVFKQVPPDAVLELPGEQRTIPFFSVFYSMDLMKSGMHHPDGMLWIRRPSRRHFVNPDKVPLTSVAPTLLELLELERPASMKAPPIAPPIRRVA